MSTALYVVGEVVAGKYRLDAMLGEGGMGAVWRAFNLQLEAPVALKVIRSSADHELLTLRLKQEARAAAKLGHPAIVRVFDVGETEFGDPFIVMELLEGQSLAALLAAQQRLAAVRAVQLLLPIAEALSAVHAAGIVHRDLKPDNIFIVVENDQIQPKLLDFGIAKLTNAGVPEAPLTQAGTVLGSPDYMSPEQARGQADLDHRTDIWSFCVLLYECLAGATPFSGPSYNALLCSIIEDEPMSLPDQLAADEQLWHIVQQGLAKDVERRFGTMNELGRALAAWLIGQGVFDDVSGGSLEAKWIARSTDPRMQRSARASFGSLSTIPPASGVRAARVTAGATANAGPTVTADAGARSLRLRTLAVCGALALCGALAVLVAALAAPAVVSKSPRGPAREMPRVPVPSSPEVSVPVVSTAPQPLAEAPASLKGTPSASASAVRRSAPKSQAHKPAPNGPKPNAPAAPTTEPNAAVQDLIQPY